MQNRSAELLRLPWERKEKLLYIRMHCIYIVALCNNWTICNWFFFFFNKENSSLHLICWFFFLSNSWLFICCRNVKGGGVKILADIDGWGLARDSFHGEGLGIQSKFLTISFLTEAVNRTAKHSSSDLITHSPCMETGVLLCWILLFRLLSVNDESPSSNKIHFPSNWNNNFLPLHFLRYLKRGFWLLSLSPVLTLFSFNWNSFSCWDTESVFPVSVFRWPQCFPPQPPSPVPATGWNLPVTPQG